MRSIQQTHREEISMNPVYRKSIFASISFIVLFLLACNATFTAGYPTPTIAPPTELPTATPAPTSQPLTISRLTYEEVGQNPGFTIKAEFPAVLDNNDTGVSNFNMAAHDLVQTAIDEFKTGISQIPEDPNFTSSFLDVKFTLLSQADNIMSIKFDFSFYSAGAAHPGDYSMVLNYDLDQGRELALGDLFIPNSNYLELISNYCIEELSKQPFFTGPFTEGADPAPENYQNWNVTSNGLMITFNTYQVAPGAAGPQIIVIPYGQLTTLIDPQGPLAGFTQ